jgi:hypothetical protein
MDARHDVWRCTGDSPVYEEEFITCVGFDISEEQTNVRMSAPWMVEGTYGGSIVKAGSSVSPGAKIAVPGWNLTSQAAVSGNIVILLLLSIRRRCQVPPATTLNMTSFEV